jgi:hypothetical protein
MGVVSSPKSHLTGHRIYHIYRNHTTPFPQHAGGRNALQFLTLPGFPFGPDPLCKHIVLPGLWVPNLYSSDIVTPLEHLYVPAVRRVKFDGYGHSPAWSLLDSSRPPPFPILDQAITKVSMIMILSESASCVFWLALEAPGDFLMDVCMI